ncbi:hypothetical protein NDU88_002953 [Pleurodeles waltl]|uniref:Uncharacterized protein n=1 Tax=Pleurodeles waltl TaxID=8319 RepID=A0AAV7MPG8_PLEWA|nr:hypothetical protein NDU88_002953 [Pleurodeles waltl]
MQAAVQQMNAVVAQPSAAGDNKQQLLIFTFEDDKELQEITVKLKIVEPDADFSESASWTQGLQDIPNHKMLGAYAAGFETERTEPEETTHCIEHV